VWEGSLGYPEHRVDVGLEQRIELLGRDLENGRLRALPGSVVDENIQATELTDGVRNELVAE
jgi:hypothetical protein